jgi:hypothetical protein
LNSLNAVRRTQNILNHSLLGTVEMRMLIGNSNSPLTRQNGLDPILSFANPADDLLLGLDGLGGGELARWLALGTLDDLEFSRSQAGVKIAANLGVGDFAHAAAETITDQCTLIDDRLALEVFVTGKR